MPTDLEAHKHDLHDLLAKIQAHLRAGGIVRVGTAYRLTDYRAKHADWFSLDSAGDLRVRTGRRHDTLSYGGNSLLVAIRFSRKA
jgi:hypothetical protein